MAFVKAWSTRTGRERLVPEHFFDNPVLSRGLTRVQPVDQQVWEPPADGATIADLQAYAGKHDIDLGDARLKDDIRAAVDAAVTTHNSNIETPATGDEEE